MRERIGALALVAVMAAVAGCSGGTETSAAPPGASAPAEIPAVCVNVASLRATVQKLTAMKAGVDSAIALRLAANNVATQTATFVSGATADLRDAAKGLKTAVEAVRASVSISGEGQAAAVTTAIAGVDAAWKEFETNLAAACPS